MAHDFEQTWPWRGASRDQLVEWLGEPRTEEFSARWKLGDARPPHPVTNRERNVPRMDVAWAGGRNGLSARLRLHDEWPAPGGPVPFSPEAWAAADAAGRSAMYSGARRAVRQLPAVDLAQLTALFGRPNSATGYVEYAVGSGYFGSFKLHIDIGEAGASRISFDDY